MSISIYMQKISIPLQPNGKFPSFKTTKIHETEKWGNSLILQSNIPRSIRVPGRCQERHRDVATGTFFHHSSTINRGLNVHDSRRRQSKNAIWSLSLRPSTNLYRAPSTVRIPGRHKPHYSPTIKGWRDMISKRMFTCEKIWREDLIVHIRTEYLTTQPVVSP